jgi:hypothetical protein
MNDHNDPVTRAIGGFLGLLYLIAGLLFALVIVTLIIGVVLAVL